VSTEDVLGIAAHFEKMLYDNAQLAQVYLHAWPVHAKNACIWGTTTRRSPPGTG
jgi:hypothetical protein